MLGKMLGKMLGRFIGSLALARWGRFAFRLSFLLEFEAVRFDWLAGSALAIGFFKPAFDPFNLGALNYF